MAGHWGIATAMVTMALLWTPEAEAEADPYTAVAAVNSSAFFSWSWADNNRPGAPHSYTLGGGGQLTLPLGRRFGLDLAISGSSLEEEDESDLIRVKLEASRVGVASHVFWRDPSRGYVSFGYSWSRSKNTRSATVPFDPPLKLRLVDEAYTNAFSIGAGLYMDAFDIGATAAYQRIDGRRGAAGDAGAYSLGAHAGVFLRDDLRAALGLGWGHAYSADEHHLSGSMGLEWQPPLGELRYLRLRVGASVGHSWHPDDLTDTTYYSAGLGLSVDWPGTTSLRHLLREYRL